MQLRTAKGDLLHHYGNVTVTLSTANTFSHSKVPISFGEYITGLQPQDGSQLGNETLYLFGPDSELGNALAPLINLYRPPAYAGLDVALSFGLGKGFSEVFHGLKRWLLYPPHHKPPFDPEVSSLAWLRDVYPGLQGQDRDLLLDCTIGPGEALYFPSMWWHAVVNIGESVFLSTFLHEQPPLSAARCYA
ncbi:hypothetical protein WJX72_009893 [[Myrmecia] bisecta]|uniref:JmjC domain-containing protein n=1 Tax=[Myrmecia] bisecta TaxID=41462 RepID=A0AAW1PKQ0_9CHLO